ncbi:MAG: LacI family DNA-binding transcriptional regulator [Azospirillaceae bacterium]
MATIKDVARLAGVSTATVSATINNTAYVSPELRSRVERAIDTLNYAPDRIARSLKRGRTNLIGLIVADITNPFFTALVQTVERRLESAGYTVLLTDTDQHPERDLLYLELMKAHRVDGVILAPSVSTQGAEIARRATMPLVLVDRPVPGLEADFVTLDNPMAAGLAVGAIIEAGHRRIGAIAGPRALINAEARIEGYRACLSEAGLPIDPALVVHCDFREEEARQAAHSLLDADPAPTALFVANNLMLLGVMRALADRGLDCPRDISVVSIDDFPWADAFNPRPTVIRQPIAAIAENAADLLLARVTGARDAPPTTRYHSPELIRRDSLGPPPAR